MSEKTLNAALRRIGYSGAEMTAHGFRASFSALVNESGLWNPDAIEHALAHIKKNEVRRACCLERSFTNCITDYYECNYGNAEMPWDKWFGTHHDGSEEATQRTRNRKRQMHRRGLSADVRQWITRRSDCD